MDKETGLTFKQVEENIKQFGFNELPGDEKESIFGYVKDLLSEPMILLLLGGSGLYLILGDLSEALALVGSVVFVIGLTLFEEIKTERALEALKAIGSPKAQVIRNGVHQTIASREVTINDLLLLNEGDRVPADAVLTGSRHLTLNESILTGESFQETKTAGQKVFMGTLVVRGQGLGKVFAIGKNAEMGKIGSSLSNISLEKSPTKKEIDYVVKRVAAIGLGFCLLLAGYYGCIHNEWVKGLLAGVTLAMSLIPEEIPVVLTVFMVIGAWRIARRNVLTRKLSAIETLGSTTVICLDKTGTITQNKMAIKALYAGGGLWEGESHKLLNLPEPYRELIKFGILASPKKTIDPLEIAIREFGINLWGTDKLFEDWELVAEEPISDNLMAVSETWQTNTGETVTAIKGAPEAVIKLCKIDALGQKQLLAIAENLAKTGLRVLAVAHSEHFLGFLGLSDPLKPEVKNSIRECHAAGIKVKLITGDHPETALKIAFEAGLINQNQKYLLGEDVKKLDFKDLKEKVRELTVFARISPAEKLRILEALKDCGEIVTMIGDGVNDAPSIKAAHVGVAMGERGTDVARESAALILLNDSFISLVDAVKLGRRIFDNIKRAVAYTWAMHLPIAILALVPAFLRLPIVFFPLHIVLLELFIDPACSIIFESVPEEPGIMNRPPRKKTDRLFNKELLTVVTTQGVVAILTTLAVYFYTMSQGLNDGQIREVTFLTLLVVNMGLVTVSRSWKEPLFKAVKQFDLTVVAVPVATVAVFCLILGLGWFREILSFEAAPLKFIVIAVLTGLLGAVWFDVYKIFRKR